MAFQTPITVKEAVNNIHAKKYLLPAIQRELVWTPDQIALLFDSLMRDYPVGSFLFWHVEGGRVGDYQFYEFIRKYHVRDNKHNPKAHLTGENDITAILDGQQRLTSLYIGLRGSYAYKERMQRWNNNAAFPERRLYLNLLSPCAEEDVQLKYDFRFLTEREAEEKQDEDHYWFRVSDILDIRENADVNDYLLERNFLNYGADKYRFANKTLYKLHSVVHEKPIVNYFLEKDESLDKVLNIFVRVNSAGTKLDYSDLLLSIASAQWQQRDAREEINAFVDEINTTGDGFDFDKDFVLKTCLVLCDIPDIAFKVDNFNRANMLKIEEKWDKITQAIRLAVNLAESFGYQRETLVSKYVLIPVSYYLMKNDSPPTYVDASRYQEDRETIRKFLIHALLKRVFSGSPDNVLRPMRKIIEANHQSFPLPEIVETLRGGTKSLIFNDDEIQALFDYKYGGPYTFSTLALLYPTLDFKNKFHQDHIFPKSRFTRRRLIEAHVSDEKIAEFIDEYDYLANLQLLEGQPNIEKSDKEFKAWLEETYPDGQRRRDYMEKHYIPDVDLSLDNFGTFIAERTKLMTQKFRSILMQ